MMKPLYQTDPCSFRGAEQLARQIKQYWADKGHKVEVWSERVYDSFYIVRSNLRNGRPPLINRKYIH